MHSRSFSPYSVFMSNEDQTIIKKSPRKIKSSFQLKERGVLVVLSGKEVGKSCLIDKEVTTIGRGETCSLVLGDDLVSKEHCLIRAEGGYFFIEDLDSSNGTYLDSKKIKKKSLLNDFERIVIGKTVLRFFIEESL